MSKVVTVDQIRSYLSNKLVLNASIIFVMRLLASAGGFLFWAVAARLLPAAQLGLASGVVSASVLLAGLAQLGLGYGLVRYYSSSHTPIRLLNAVLLVVAVNGLALGGCFLAGLPLWSPALQPLLAGSGAMLVFLLLVAGTGLTQLLNWFFLARREPAYSLIKNTAQSVLAVLILLLLGSLSRGYLAAVHAYTLATLGSLLLAIVWFLPRTQPGYVPRPVLPRTIRTSFAGYSLKNFFADQFGRLVNTVLPLMVLNVLGAEAAGYFFVVWSISAGLASLTESVASSFLAESAHRPEHIGEDTRRSIQLAVAGSIVAALAAIVLSRYILAIYGPLYVQNARWPLILLAITLVPISVVPIYTNYLRARDRLSALIVFAACDVGLAIVSMYILMLRHGLVGAVLGWMLSRLVLLGVMTVQWRRQVKSERQGLTQRV